MPLPRTPGEFVHREAELARLDECLGDPGCRVFVLVGWRGMGKTALVVRWLDLLAERGRLEDTFGTLGEAGWTRALERLRELGVLAGEDPERPGLLDVHPLVREHFSARLRATDEAAWREGHRRLLEHYRGGGRRSYRRPSRAWSRCTLRWATGARRDGGRRRWTRCSGRGSGGAASTLPSASSGPGPWTWPASPTSSPSPGTGRWRTSPRAAGPSCFPRRASTCWSWAAPGKGSVRWRRRWN